jgi:type IV secretory pathway TraG/TraD family ATPase VirD4
MSGDRTIARPGVLDSPGEYLLVAVLALTAAVMTGTWLTGQLAGLLFRQSWPPASISQSLSIALRLSGHLGDPRMAWPAPARPSLPGPAGFAAAALLTAVLMIAAAILAGRRILAGRSRRGYASARQIRTRLSEKAVLARADVIRPSLAGQPKTVTDAGVRAGRALESGVPVAISAESSVVAFAAPRIGKTSQVVIPWLKDWPGPALVTSVRPDVLENTATLRAGRGPVLVMAPTGMLTWPDMAAWSPASRCASFDLARQRADVMVTVGKHGKDTDSGNAAYFGMMAVNLLAGWLHAAAISSRGMDDVLTWALDERNDEPVKILRDHPAAAAGTAAMLDAAYRSPEVTRSNLWTTTQTAIAPLLAPAARATFAPPPGTGLDIEDVLRANGTIYLLASEKQGRVIAPLVTAFFDELTETAKQLADRAPGGRLDPPLGLFLDEAANIVPLPDLPALMSYAGGSGIFVLTVLQNRAQAEQRWGREGAAMLWGAATVKIALGGLSGAELRDLSDLAGQYREALTSYQRGSTGHTLQTTLQDRKVITPEEIRTLDELDRQALIIHATTPAIRARMPRHYEGPDRDQYAAAREQTRASIAKARPGSLPATLDGGLETGTQ